MARSAAIAEPNFPWVDYQEDRRFRRFSIAFTVVFLLLGIGINFIELPEVERKALVDVSPRLAQLIVEKKKAEPPPKVEKKPEVKKKEPEKKKEVKKKPEKKKEQPKKRTDREVAQNSGLLKLTDELEDLRELFDVGEVTAQPQKTGGSQEIKIASASDLLSSSAQQSSGGIKTDTLNRNLKTSELSQRQTTRVESKIQSDQNQLAKAETTSGSGSQRAAGKTRNPGEIERVFQTRKGEIYRIYQRELRKDPTLEGKVVIELTIAPNGTVTAAKILSSELGNKALERKLLVKIKQFKFSNANFAETTVTYPIDFLPS